MYTHSGLLACILEGLLLISHCVLMDDPNLSLIHIEHNNHTPIISMNYKFKRFYQVVIPQEYLFSLYK